MNKATTADALTAIVKGGESISPSMVKSAYENKHRTFGSLSAAAWCVILNAGCDTSTGTKWSDLLNRIENDEIDQELEAEAE